MGKFIKQNFIDFLLVKNFYAQIAVLFHFYIKTFSRLSCIIYKKNLFCFYFVMKRSKIKQTIRLYDSSLKRFPWWRRGKSCLERKTNLCYNFEGLWAHQNNEYWHHKSDSFLLMFWNVNFHQNLFSTNLHESVMIVKDKCWSWSKQVASKSNPIKKNSNYNYSMGIIQKHEPDDPRSSYLLMKLNSPCIVQSNSHFYSFRRFYTDQNFILLFHIILRNNLRFNWYNRI